MGEFKIISEYKPTGDQPDAIEKLTAGVINGKKYQTLLGVTGSGKTYTIANVIEKTGRPTLVLAHNKTLAAQLCLEFKEFFPENAVEYFVSYYDYYQPEAYVPSRDMYIEKDSAINDEIDKLRHSATAALFERRDVIIVASVSCIYSLGDPVDYENMVISLRPGMEKTRDDLLRKLVEIQYSRNDINFVRNTFRVRGDTVEIYPAGSDENAVRIEFFGDEIDRISEINTVTGEISGYRNHIAVFPASHYVTGREKILNAIMEIEHELEERVAYFKEKDMLLEAQRIEQRTHYDIEMLREMGMCQGVENYSRILSGREPGSRPFTLIDYFPDDFLMVIDESHVMLPQVRAMYSGDKARKTTLVDYGFRLPSALDNRPLDFKEFWEILNQTIFVSATPSEFEKNLCDGVVEQVIRPTGIVDPQVYIRPVKGQIDDLLGEIRKRAERKERILVTTLTKKMAEDLTKYFEEMEVKVKYLHSDVETLDRIEIIRELRLGVFDVLIGINLLREGLDIPEVSLVAILDADKEGFLRSEISLIQTIGRAARNVEGIVILYADNITGSMERAISETNRRREIQKKYNEDNQIVPKSIVKKIVQNIENTIAIDDEGERGFSSAAENKAEYKSGMKDKKKRGKTTKLQNELAGAFSAQEAYIIAEMNGEERKYLAGELENQMYIASKALEFERAAQLRDQINALNKIMK